MKIFYLLLLFAPTFNGALTDTVGKTVFITLDETGKTPVLDYINITLEQYVKQFLIGTYSIDHYVELVFQEVDALNASLPVLQQSLNIWNVSELGRSKNIEIQHFVLIYLIPFVCL